jgi:hypothetical protein
MRVAPLCFGLFGFGLFFIINLSIASSVDGAPATVVEA